MSFSFLIRQVKCKVDTKKIMVEDSLLQKSIFSSLFLSVIGVSAGFLLSSSFVLFDGLYALLSVILSIFSLGGGRFITVKDDIHFPFGKEALEPILVFFQYLIVFLLLIYAFVNSVDDIRSGGNPVELGWVIGYLCLTAIIAIGVFRHLKQLNKSTRSILATAEVEQWRITVIMGIGAVIGYSIAGIAKWFEMDQVARYIDPIMVILIVLYLIRYPIREMVKSMREMLGMSTSENLMLKIRENVLFIANQYDVEDVYLRISKTGSIIFIEIDLIVPKIYAYDSIIQQDAIRERIDKSLFWLPQNKWLTIAFTANRKWAE